MIATTPTHVLNIAGFTCRVTVPRMTIGPWDAAPPSIAWKPRRPNLDTDLTEAEQRALTRFLTRTGAGHATGA